MNKLMVLLILAMLLPAKFLAQECPLYYPDSPNSQLEYQHYDKKGKLNGSNTQKVTDFKRTGNGYEVRVTAENFDARGSSLGTMELAARCSGGVFYIDMKNLIDSKSLESYKDMEMQIEGGNLELPSSMKAGDLLKSGDMKIAFSSNGMVILNMSFNVTNRKVEAIESITTPAGTFECYKISYDMATKTIVNVKTKGTEWYSKGVGLIKSETYSTDGKLLGSTVLASVKK